MSDKNTPLSRDELFELVWSKPTTRITAEFQVPVTAVIKACAYLKVPRPAAGHWSAVNFGTVPSRPPLPAVAASEPQSTTLGEWCLRRKTRKPRAIEIVKPEASSAPVGENPPAHPIAVKTRAAYRGAEKDSKYGLLVAMKGRAHLRLAIRPESLDRTIDLLGRLLPKLEAKGFIFVPDSKTPERITTVFAATKTQVDWYVQEVQERYQRELKPEEKDRSWIWDQWQYRSTGRLRVAITEYYPQGAAKSWGDGKHQKLDGKLDDIAEGFLVCAQGIHAQAVAWEKQRRGWAEEARLREEHEAWRKAEAKRRTDFQEAAGKWSAAQELRAFRAACEGSLRSKSPAGSELSSSEEKWLSWADTVANAMDPLRGDYLAKAILERRLGDLTPAQLGSLQKSAEAIRPISMRKPS